MTKSKTVSEKARKFKQGQSVFERTWLGQIFGTIFGIGKNY